VEGRVGVPLRIGRLGDHLHPRRQVEARGEPSARRLRHAVHGPGAATGMEGAVIGGMPVARGEDGQPTIAEEGDPFVQSWNDRVPIAHHERAAGQEVVLHVDQEERITPAHRFRTVPHRLLSSGYTRPWVQTRPVARSGGAAYVEGAW